MRKKIEETEENNEITPKKRSLKIDPKIRLERFFSD